MYQKHTRPIRLCGNLKWVIVGHKVLSWGGDTLKSRFEFVSPYVLIMSLFAVLGHYPLSTLGCAL